MINKMMFLLCFLAHGIQASAVELYDLKLHALSQQIIRERIPCKNCLLDVRFERFLYRKYEETADNRSLSLAHQATMFDGAFSPDGTLALTCFREGTAYIWSCINGRAVHILTHDDSVLTGTFNHDGSRVATGSRDGTVNIWNVQTGTLERSLPHNAWVRSVQFSPDGEMIVSRTDGNSVSVWDTLTGDLLGTLTHDCPVRDCAMSSDGTLVVTCSSDSTAKIWDLATQKVTPIKHGKSVISVDIDAQGTYLLTGSSDKHARVWTVATGECKAVLEHRYEVTKVAFRPNSEEALTWSRYEDSAKLWNIHTGKLVRKFSVPEMRPPTFSVDGELLCAGSHRSWPRLVENPWPWDRQEWYEPVYPVRVWDVNLGICVYELYHTNKISAATFSPDGKKVLTGGWNTNPQLTSLATVREIQAFIHDHSIDQCYFLKEVYHALTHHGRIQTSTEQWHTFTKLPETIQKLVQLYVKKKRGTKRKTPG